MILRKRQWWLGRRSLELLVALVTAPMISGCDRGDSSPTAPPTVDPLAVSNIEALEDGRLDGMDAQTWHKKYLDVYMHAQTFQEHGRVDCIESDGQTTRFVGEYEINYKRPDGFRFVFRGEIPDRKIEYAIWSEQASMSVQTWQNDNPRIWKSDLQLATGTAFGLTLMSSGLAVDALLRPDHGRPEIGMLDAKEPYIIGTGDVSGRSCVRIRHIMQPGDQCTLWIDRETFLLRRVEVVWKKLKGGTSITMSPQIGVRFDRDSFAYTPPN